MNLYQIFFGACLVCHRIWFKSLFYSGTCTKNLWFRSNAVLSSTSCSRPSISYQIKWLNHIGQKHFYLYKKRQKIHWFIRHLDKFFPVSSSFGNIQKEKIRVYRNGIYLSIHITKWPQICKQRLFWKFDGEESLHLLLKPFNSQTI